MKQSKTEIRAQLLNDTLTYVMNGGVISEVAPQRKKIKVTCRAKSANSSFGKGGNEPTFGISSIYTREV